MPRRQRPGERASATIQPDRGFISLFKFEAVHVAGALRVGPRSKTSVDCRAERSRPTRGRLQLHAPAYNLGNFLRTLATPEPIKDWSMASLKDKLDKIGAKIVSPRLVMPNGKALR